MMEKVHFVSTYSDRYPLSIEGESNYQENINSLIPYVDSDKKRYREDGFSAELILEDDNPYDPNNAVRVEIDGEIVGHLSMGNARRYRKGLAKINLTNVIGVCGAAIFGKKEYEFGDMNFGVWLDLDLKDLQIEHEHVKTSENIPSPQPPPVASSQPFIPAIQNEGNKNMTQTYATIMSDERKMEGTKWQDALKSVLDFLNKRLGKQPPKRRKNIIGWAIGLSICCLLVLCIGALDSLGLLPTSTPTITPTLTFTATETRTPTITRTPTDTFTPTIYLSPTITLTPTITQTPTKTLTPTKTPDPLLAIHGDGIYLVNVDIAPGVWRSQGTGDICYWEITTKTGDIINNHFGMAGGTAYISPLAFQVTFQDCGDWIYLGPP
jgi:hypothetical protein